MSQEEALNLLFFSIFAIIFLWLFYGPWQRLVVDLARQRMFELRDEVFDLAHFDKNCNVDRDTEAYRQARENFNLLIRFAHKMSLFKLPFVAAMMDDSPSPESRPIESYPDDIKARIAEASTIFIGSLILRSLPGFLLAVFVIIPIRLILKVFKGGRRIKKAFEQFAIRLEPKIERAALRDRHA